jgi:uncharacterized membrane protein YhdT
VTDKIQPSARQVRFRKTVRHYLLLTILAFLAFLCFDMADGNADGVRGLATFFGLVTGV